MLSRLGLFGVIVLLAPACVDATPETPGNAVMEYLIAAGVGDEDDANGRLCERLRSDPTEEETATLNRVVHESSVFGEGTIEETDDSAVVALEVLRAPASRDAVGDPWVAYMVKEGGRWKVCGFEPNGSAEGASREAESSTTSTDDDCPPVTLEGLTVPQDCDQEASTVEGLLETLEATYPGLYSGTELACIGDRYSQLTGAERGLIASSVFSGTAEAHEADAVIEELFTACGTTRPQ